MEVAVLNALKLIAIHTPAIAAKALCSAPCVFQYVGHRVLLLRY